jgi:hypothetical protein
MYWGLQKGIRKFPNGFLFLKRLILVKGEFTPKIEMEMILNVVARITFIRAKHSTFLLLQCFPIFVVPRDLMFW